jgi:ketosteroid isomerase-like protein
MTGGGWGAGTAQRAELIERFSAAWSAGDLDALMAMMTDDCTFSASVGPEPGATFHGRQEVRRGFSLFLASASASASAAPPPETVTEPPLIAEDFAVTRWTSRYPGGGGPPVLVRACDIFGFHGDRIRFKDTYRKLSAELPAGG